MSVKLEQHTPPFWQSLCQATGIAAPMATVPAVPKGRKRKARTVSQDAPAPVTRAAPAASAPIAAPALVPQDTSASSVAQQSAEPAALAPTAAPELAPHTARTGTHSTALSKAEKNKFTYKLKFADAAIKDKWLDISKMPNTPDKPLLKREFQDEILASVGKTFDSTYFQHIREQWTETKEGEEGAWVSYAKFISIDGEAVAQDRIKRGTVLMRRHKGLSEDSEIKFPYNQQFRVSEDTFSNMTINKDILTCTH